MQPFISQVDGFFDFFVSVTGFSATGTDDNITTALGTAANTAGRGGTSVPVQLRSATQMGFYVAGANQCPVFNSITREKIRDASGNVVFAELTFAASVYTVSYFTWVSSTKTAYSFAAATPIDILCPYQFQVGRLPADFAVRVNQRYVGEDVAVSGAAGASMFGEVLEVTALNTIAPLTKNPSVPGAVQLVVRGINEHGLSGGGFTLIGKAITWVPGVAGYDLQVGWNVYALYPTFE
jgi:hypothetical protein